MKKRMGLGALMALAVFLVLPGSAMAQGQGALDTIKGELDITWVMVACVLVLFMQAGFLLLEIGFSTAEERRYGRRQGVRQPRRGHARMVGGRLRDLVADGQQDLRHRGLLLPRRAGHRRAPGRRHRYGADAVRHVVLCRLPRDRLGHDARADQVRRLRDLRARLRRDHLSAGRPRRLRRRLPRRRRRQAGDGLRRIVGRPPHRSRRRHSRRSCCSARGSGKYDAGRQATRDPGALDAAGRPRRR